MKVMTLRSQGHSQFALMSSPWFPNPSRSFSQQKYCPDPRGLQRTRVLTALLLKIPGSVSG